MNIIEILIFLPLKVVTYFHMRPFLRKENCDCCNSNTKIIILNAVVILLEHLSSIVRKFKVKKPQQLIMQVMHLTLLNR